MVSVEDLGAKRPDLLVFGLSRLQRRGFSRVAGKPTRQPRCRVALKSGTRRVGQRLLPLNVTFRRQLVGVFLCFAVQSGQLLQEDGALFQTHEARQLLRTHRGQC